MSDKDAHLVLEESTDTATNREEECDG